MKDIKIDFPQEIESCFKNIAHLIKTLADESDNFPFSSEDMNMSEEAIKQFLTFLIYSPNSTLCLVYIGDSLIGLGFLEGGKKPRTYHLSNLGIGVLNRYANQGVGSKIMDALIEYSRASEYIAKIDIIVRADNRHAINLYKHKGFNLEGKSKRSLFIDGEFFDMLYMGFLVD